MYINLVVEEKWNLGLSSCILQPFIHSDQSPFNCVPLEQLQDTDSSLTTISPHQSSHYPDYLSPTWDKDTQRAVVWTRLWEHHKLANHSLAKINEWFLALHQEHQSTQAKSSHKLSSHDMQTGLCLPRQCHWLHRITFPSGHWWQLGYEPLVGCYRCEPYFKMKWNGKANVEICLELRGCLSWAVLCWGGMCQSFYSLMKDVWHSVNLWCWHICYSDGQLFFCQTLVNPQRHVCSLFICNLDLSQVWLIAIHPPWPHFSMPEDFPYAHPGCHHTFKRWNTRTQHYNPHHQSLSPDSEPDPAHQFDIKYHLKLNGTYSVHFVEDALLISSHSFALQSRWKISSSTCLTTTTSGPWCNRRQCIPSIQRLTCVWLGPLPFYRASVICMRNQQGLGPLACIKFESCPRYTITLVFSGGNVSDNRCHPRGRCAFWDHSVQICRSNLSQSPSLDDGNIWTLYTKLSNTFAPSTCHNWFCGYLQSKALPSI